MAMRSSILDHHEAELLATYSQYARALRILIRDGVNQNDAPHSFCWKQLERLYYCLPRQCLHPDDLYGVLLKEVARSTIQD